MTFRIFYVFIVLEHARRRIVHFNVVTHATPQWTSQQIVEAFPFDTAPRYLLRDNDGIYGTIFLRRIVSMGIDDVPTAPLARRNLGRIRSLNVSSAQFVANAWTTSSY